MPASDRISTTLPLTRHLLDQEADRVMLGSLRPATAAAAICFSVFGVYNAIAMPPQARIPLVVFDVAIVLASVALHFACRRDLVAARLANVVMGTLTMSVIGNILLALWLMGEPAAAYYVSLVLVISAGGTLRTGWAVSVGALGVACWAVIAQMTRTPEELLHDVFVLFAGATVATISHLARAREHARIAELRERDAQRKRELERALADAAAARDDLDRKVEARTSELRNELAERARLEEQLRHAQKMEAVGRLAGGVAHDFNNLLTVITSGLELVRGEPDVAPDTREGIADAREATARATELTRGLLALGRKQTLDRARTRVVDTLDGVERMIVRLAGAKVRVVRTVEADVGDVIVDRGQIEQVLLNLAINACDAMPDGGTLTMSAGTVYVDAATGALQHLEPGPYVRLAVEDTGAGMDAATRASIFEPFFTTKPVGKGTGLGLAIAHGIVTQHGGSIEVESQLGRGSKFSFLLPRAPAVTAATPQESSSHPPKAATAAQTILVVEDEAGVRRSLGRTLGGLGYRVILASDGDDALRLANGLPAIDLLLSDVIMPGIDGPEVASRLRQRWPSLRVLFVSGYSDDRLARAGIHDRLLAKPYTTTALATAVREVIVGPDAAA